MKYCPRCGTEGNPVVKPFQYVAPAKFRFERMRELTAGLSGGGKTNMALAEIKLLMGVRDRRTERE